MSLVEELAAHCERPGTVRQGELRIFASENEVRVKFIADGLPVAAGKLVEKAFFDTPVQAALVAAACAWILARTPGCQADRDGWHDLPRGAQLSRFLPTLLHAARNTAWTNTVLTSADDPEPEVLEPVGERSPISRRQHWTRQRVAWLGFLVGRGWTAKRIAADELISSTPGNVHQRALEFGLSLSSTPQRQICCELPPATLDIIDRAAAAAHLQRDAFIRRLLIRAANDPGRFGLVIVSND